MERTLLPRKTGHLGKREHRVPDLAAWIPLKRSGKSVLVHLEIEKLYILNVVISLYLKLQDDEQARFEAALAKEKAMLPELPNIPLSLAEYEETLEKRLAEGKHLGLAEGKHLGLAEGKHLGLAEGKKTGVAESIVRLVGRRFGSVPESLKVRLEAIADPARLQEIFDAAIDASSVSQLEATLAGG